MRYRKWTVVLVDHIIGREETQIEYTSPAALSPRQAQGYITTCFTSLAHPQKPPHMLGVILL